MIQQNQKHHMMDMDIELESPHCYAEEDKQNIMATLIVVQEKGWSPKNTDQYQFHIVLGEKL